MATNENEERRQALATLIQLKKDRIGIWSEGAHQVCSHAIWALRNGKEIGISHVGGWKD